MTSVGLVGFIGLGNMGRAMAANLANAGIELIVYDRAGTAERAPKNAQIAASAAHVAAHADPVILSLPDGDAVRAVIGDIVSHAGTVAHTRTTATTAIVTT